MNDAEWFGGLMAAFDERERPTGRQVGRVKIVKRYDEYVVRAWDTDGRRYSEADYYTNDRADARTTAATMCSN